MRLGSYSIVRVSYPLFSKADDARSRLGTVVDDGGLGKMVGTAVDFSLGFIFIPSFLEVTVVNSKKSSVKCSQHIAEYLLGPFHSCPLHL